MSSSLEPITPWYRQLWPWILILIPATSVVLGFVMLYLAMNTNNSLVVDDYYKQGKGINLRIERDRLATRLGLTAEIRTAPDGLLLELIQLEGNVAGKQTAAAAGFEFKPPQQLRVTLVHSTQASKDVELAFTSIGGNTYVTPSQQFTNDGHWRMHIHPVLNPDSTESEDWRLVSEAKSYTSGDFITISSTEFTNNRKAPIDEPNNEPE